MILILRWFVGWAPRSLDHNPDHPQNLMGWSSLRPRHTFGKSFFQIRYHFLSNPTDGQTGKQSNNTTKNITILADSTR